ncbi:hypothetical protein SAMN05661096_00808 [Marivirga sericea]|uniref:DUF4359 domain-containing protein n=1 Tax=Marivirga sericea TaxID=1028 RepID=A0A1X7ILI8_9BACT|nr:hypothetical protein [Marivirga sericea]SMG15790.1 hypothetical protein SAMN05661096_00808 [Marivirga sericea]
MTRKLLIVLILALVVVVLLTPKQDAFFRRLAADYGELHQNADLSINDLHALGDFKFQNRVVYSHFEYQFGNISVSYFGFLSFVIFEKSEFKEQRTPTITV